MDDDCPLTKACVAQECVDPCITTSCGRNAECKVQRHKAICVCPRGMQGNPLVACTEVGCRTNDDCADNEKCDYLNGVLGKRECQPLCRRNPCAQNAICKATGHQEVCECQPPYQGDGYTTCYKRKIITAKVFCRYFSLNNSFLLNICSKTTRPWTRVQDWWGLSERSCLHWCYLPEPLRIEQPLHTVPKMCGWKLLAH